MHLDDHYRTLGVSVEASQEEIEQAYRLLARRWHPDVNPSPEAHEQMVRLNQAYQTLKDPTRRQRYDTLRRMLRRLEREAPLTAAPSRWAALYGPARDPLRQAVHWQQDLHTTLEAWQERVWRVYLRQGYHWEQTLPRTATITDLLFSRKRLFRAPTYLLIRLHLCPFVQRQDIQTFLAELRTAKGVQGLYLTLGRFLPAAARLAKEENLTLLDGPAWHARLSQTR